MRTSSTSNEGISYLKDFNMSESLKNGMLEEWNAGNSTTLLNSTKLISDFSLIIPYLTLITSGLLAFGISPNVHQGGKIKLGISLTTTQCHIHLLYSIIH
jgi:hypothetical protein